MKKIDVFTHIWTEDFYEALRRETGQMVNITRRSESVPMMTNLDRRFEVMDMFEDYCQVLTLASPALETVGSPEKALELSRIGSDSLAELCSRYPDRFPGFVGTAPMNNPDALVEESRRAIEDLKACGMQIFTNVNGKPLDLPEFRPFFEYMAKVDRPVWMHPARTARFSDYATEEKSLYEIWWTFGWPYETSAAMARLVFSKTFDALPNLKIITHHAGGMVPFFEGRVGPGWDQLGARTSDVDYKALLRELKHRPIDYFKLFYADTATFGSRMAILSALDFFGADHVLFASDAPFDPEGGPFYIRETIRILDALEISEADRELIYQGNAVRMMGLRI